MATTLLRCRNNAVVASFCAVPSSVGEKMPRIRLFPRRCLLAVFFCFCAAGLSSAAPAKSNEPKWARISSAHFAVLTDADDKKNREIVLRLEQMRDIFSQLFRKAKLRLPEPLEAIA